MILLTIKMKIGKKGIELIKRFEGFKANAYKCPAGVWTIGYGTTKDVKKDDVVNQKEAEKLLKEHLSVVESFINNLNLNLTQNQFDAICSFVYNVGRTAFLKSTLLKQIKANTNSLEIAIQFKRWNKANGYVLPGLIARRKAEAELYNS